MQVVWYISLEVGVSQLERQGWRAGVGGTATKIKRRNQQISGKIDRKTEYPIEVDCVVIKNGKNDSLSKHLMATSTATYSYCGIFYSKQNR